jgi:pyruvate kinase
MIPHSWQRTKIVCTLGPATDSPGVIEQLIEYGMDVARVNASHGDHADHARRIERVRNAAHALGQPVAILIDLPGPKFRIGDLPDDFRKLTEGAIVRLAAEGGIAEEGGGAEEYNTLLPVRDPELLHALRAGESVFLADGSIELCVKTTSAANVQCEVIIGGTVRSGSGINVPESILSELVPTDDDRRHLAFAVAQEIEWVGVSFVQSAGDLARVRACLPSGPGPGAQPLLMAKIEKRQALADLDAIVEASDGVMVARGDLGVETDLAEIPVVQKRIIAVANAHGRPVVTATQMLESMVEREHPTRAEATDVANAVLDGTDAVMLSAETAIGQFPIAAVRFLARVLTATEKGYSLRMAHDRMRATDMPSSPDQPGNALSFAACQLAARLSARAIIVPAHTMAAALAIARFRPQAPLIVVASSMRLYRSLALVRGVSPLLSIAASDTGTGTGTGPQACLIQAGEWLVAQGLAEPGDQVVLVSASSSACERADTLRTIRLSWDGGTG